MAILWILWRDISEERKNNMADNLREVVTRLALGGIIVYPTETSYAIGCDARNGAAVSRIFEVKKRSRAKSLPVIVASKNMALAYADFTALGALLASRYWPGPLTLVAQCKVLGLSRGIIAEDGSLALRVSSHETARVLSQMLGAPLVATSANLSGGAEAYCLQDVRTEFGVGVDWYLDGGLLPLSPPSTIVDVRGEQSRVLRQGVITLG